MDSSLWRPTPAGVWTGRIDGDGAEHARWHQRVRPLQTGASGDVAVVGFASDEGVRRNHGRVGAAEAPDALRRALAPLALGSLASGSGTDLNTTVIHDAGTVTVADDDLEDGHAALALQVAALLDTHRLVVVLGGGHETAYGSYLGRVEAARCRDARVGVLNLDAHFDLRDAPRASSGTPFLQMARADRAAGRHFRYTVLGIAAASNTRVLFEQAAAMRATYVLDKHCQPRHLPHVLEVVDELLDDIDLLHLSIDVDVLPAATAPGVSAPGAYGVPMETLVAVVEHAAASGKTALVDVVEVAPRYDIDGHTCRAAARLVSCLVEALPGSRP